MHYECTLGFTLPNLPAPGISNLSVALVIKSSQLNVNNVVRMLLGLQDHQLTAIVREMAYYHIT